MIKKRGMRGMEKMGVPRCDLNFFNDVKLDQDRTQ